jgi:hypothetical protein
VSTRDGQVRIFHEDAPNKLTVVETLKTAFRTGTMGINAKTHNLFLTTADFCPTPAAPRKGNPLGGTEAHPGTFRVLILRALEKSWSSRRSRESSSASFQRIKELVIAAMNCFPENPGVQ